MLCGVHMLVISHNVMWCAHVSNLVMWCAHVSNLVMWCAHGSSNLVCLDAGPPLNPVLPGIAAKCIS